ncbi:uncharacterized protein LOC141631661 [Silene latifolia]|uniref:uncharacterized protein LOC141631661 n=1 Tax=Silene latifolia TaxID=37657 RepID=UPI003D77BBB5
MVEVRVGHSLPNYVEFVDEMGHLVKQQVFYKWKLVICATCTWIGHETGVYKKQKPKKVQKPVQKVWVPKVHVHVTKPQVQVSQKENPEVLPTLDPSAVVTPMPYQGSVLNSVTPARILVNVVRRENGSVHNRPSFMDVLQYSSRKNLLNSLSKGKLSLHPHVNNDIRDGGRIWILWNPSIFTVNVIKKEVQVIHLHVFHLQFGYAWACSMVYGCKKYSDRRDLWISLIQMKSSCMDPLLVMGDFKNFLYFDERIGSAVTSAEIREFQDCVDLCGLYDLIVTGAYYTWNNKQEGECRVSSRIDRVMANSLWILNGPSSIANFLPEGLYDHSPCILSL